MDIIDHHLRGTRFGIGVDPQDGLLRQGAEGYQLTWMDAKVGDWVVTPRRGKAVEINALWYNALRLLEQWLREEKRRSRAPADCRACRAGARVVQPALLVRRGRLSLRRGRRKTAATIRRCRPNQILAISLRHPGAGRSDVEAGARRRCSSKLLTPVGLRSLAPGHPDYKPKYYGDLRSRDAAYHQGTVWAWLIGPFIDAWLKVHPDDRRRRARLLDGFVPHLGEACIGSISEIFDAEAPFTPRGCIAQAWSVAEVLRCLVKVEAAIRGASVFDKGAIAVPARLRPPGSLVIVGA